MKNTIRIIIALVGSFLLFAVGLFRIFTDSLPTTPLFVASIFIITGLIGVIANSLTLKK